MPNPSWLYHNRTTAKDAQAAILRNARTALLSNLQSTRDAFLRARQAANVIARETQCDTFATEVRAIDDLLGSLIARVFETEVAS